MLLFLKTRQFLWCYVKPAIYKTYTCLILFCGKINVGNISNAHGLYTFLAVDQTKSDMQILHIFSVEGWTWNIWGANILSEYDCILSGLR